MYGDESLDDEIVAYGIVCVKEEKIRPIKEYLNEIKSQFDIPLKEAIHCRTMFHRVALDRRAQTYGTEIKPTGKSSPDGRK
ncbi:MAG: hypothetical protein COT73_06755 [Bdellovibrio sp. CG10_big_fil_rev_8_21_14_0_10_47_8]|nr:MAG: hypothetical protein COT73_06755 [Bdellovibrio sp. CG10_big_fil_rev_8_21_14_0_10_47_8]